MNVKDENNILTILVFTYNHKEYIAKALDSILEQKTDFPYKIHVLDDSSTDGASDIIGDYVRKYPALITHYRNEKNLGPQANLWNGFKRVDTKYFAILEGDDYWIDGTKLEQQLAALEEHPDCTFSAHNTRIIYQAKPEMNMDLVEEELLTRQEKITYKDIEYIHSGYMTHTSSRIIRSSAIDLDKIKEKESVLFDNCLFYYLLLKGSMYYIDKVMSVYRHTGKGNYTGRTNMRRLSIFINAMEEFNRETDFAVATKIYRDVVIHIGEHLKAINEADEAFLSWKSKMSVLEQSKKKKRRKWYAFWKKRTKKA